jgi:hypothetical protein
MRANTGLGHRPDVPVGRACGSKRSGTSATASVIQIDGSALFVRSGRKPSATPPVRSGERLYGAPNARHGTSSNVGDDHGRRVRDRRVIAPSRAERRRSYTLYERT